MTLTQSVLDSTQNYFIDNNAESILHFFVLHKQFSMTGAATRQLGTRVLRQICALSTRETQTSALCEFQPGICSSKDIDWSRCALFSAGAICIVPQCINSVSSSIYCDDQSDEHSQPSLLPHLRHLTMPHVCRGKCHNWLLCMFVCMLYWTHTHINTPLNSTLSEILMRGI